MDIKQLAKQAEKYTVDNSPLILTGVGVAGTITTAVLTGKAAVKADRILQSQKLWETKFGEGHDLTKKEKFNLVWKVYVPAAGVGAVTVTAIVGANQIGTRRAAAVAAAYAVSEKAFVEYKDKVVEKFGETKHQQVRDAVAEDRMKSEPVSEREVIIAQPDGVLCYESFTGRYFKSSMEDLKKAQNDLNYRVLNDNYASLSQFYDFLGLPHTDISDDMGWNLDKQMEIEFSTQLADDGRPCIVLSYNVVPIRDFFRLH